MKIIFFSILILILFLFPQNIKGREYQEQIIAVAEIQGEIKAGTVQFIQSD